MRRKNVKIDQVSQRISYTMLLRIGRNGHSYFLNAKTGEFERYKKRNYRRYVLNKNVPVIKKGDRP